MTVLSPGQAAAILFGVFFIFLFLRVPVAFALALACLPVLAIEPRLSAMGLVQETFKVSRIGTIAGCRVTDGVIRRQAKARLIRDGVVIWDGDIATLKRFKDDVNEVRQGFECGISLVNFNDIKVEDEIEAYVIEKIAATEL